MSNEKKHDNPKKNKKNLLKIILFAIISLLILAIIVGISLYLFGYFDTKKIKEEKNPIKKVEKEKIIPKNTFTINQINSAKLNKLLSNLTKNNLEHTNLEEKEKLENERQILENEKIKEKNFLKKQKKFLEEEKLNLEKKKLQLENEKKKIEKLKNENIKLKNELERKHINNKTLIPKNTKIKNIRKKTFNLIKVATIKGVLYKSYLDKITNINPNIILCRDIWNNIEIYYDSFSTGKQRDQLLNKLHKNGFKDAYKVELSQEEYDKSCNY